MLSFDNSQSYRDNYSNIYNLTYQQTNNNAYALYLSKLNNNIQKYPRNSPGNKENINKKESKKPFIFGNKGKIKKKYEGESEINIIFRNESEEISNVPEVVIRCSLNDKISTLIIKYKRSIDNYFSKNKLFIFNNKELLPNKTLEDSKLYMNCVIKVYDKNN